MLSGFVHTSHHIPVFSNVDVKAARCVVARILQWLYPPLNLQQLGMWQAETMTHIGNGTGNHAAFITAATTILMTENTTRATNNISPMLLVLLLLSPHACVTQSYGQRHACSSSRPSWWAISPFLEPSKALPNCQVTSHTAAAGMHAYAWQPHMALYSCGLWLLRPLASPIPGIDCMIGGNGESSPRLHLLMAPPCPFHSA